MVQQTPAALRAREALERIWVELAYRLLDVAGQQSILTVGLLHPTVYRPAHTLSLSLARALPHTCACLPPPLAPILSLNAHPQWRSHPEAGMALVCQHQLQHVVQRGHRGSCWAAPHAVEVSAPGVGPIVAEEHSVWIQHGHDHLCSTQSVSGVNAQGVDCLHVGG
eukprot:365756-Chlamydomonas_euryale.AAC.1